MKNHLLSMLLPALLGLGACTLSLDGVPVGDGRGDDAGAGEGDAQVDGGEATAHEPLACDRFLSKVTPAGTDKLDVLFVVDNSHSMAEEQAKLMAQIPRFVAALESGDLRDGGSARDFSPVSSLRLGVVSSDIGTHPYFSPNVPGCDDEGDDGLMRSEVSAAMADVPACAGEGFGDKPYLHYVPGEGGSADAAQSFACVATLGTTGCSMEQPLDAMWKALAPGNVYEFVESSSHGKPANGEGDDGNKGFLRDDAVLVVVHLSDEDDCSVTKPGLSLFDPSGDDDPRFVYDGSEETLAGKLEGIDFRCAHEAQQFESPELLQSPFHYARGLRSLKPDHPERVIFAAIVGIPERTESLFDKDGSQWFHMINIAEEMRIRPGLKVCTPEQQATDESCGKPSVDAPPVPACTGEGGSASPARRFVDVADEFHHDGLVGSICRADYALFFDRLLAKIGSKLAPGCLPSPVHTDELGLTECKLLEILAEGDDTCDPARGHIGSSERREVAGVWRTACEVEQIITQNRKILPQTRPPGSIGWYYDSESADVLEYCPVGSRQRVRFTDKASPPEGSTLELTCALENHDEHVTGLDAVGRPCTSSEQCGSESEASLRCEQGTKTCQVACGDGTVCPTGWSCEPGQRSVEGDSMQLCLPSACPAPPASDARWRCLGPYSALPELTCEPDQEMGGERHTTSTLAECFRLCAADAGCRAAAAVAYDEADDTCVLRARCAEPASSFQLYQAESGCIGPRVCWGTDEVEEDPRPCQPRDDVITLTGTTLDFCILYCEWDDTCRKNRLVQYDETEGECSIVPVCAPTDDDLDQEPSLVTYHYREIDCFAPDPERPTKSPH